MIFLFLVDRIKKVINVKNKRFAEVLTVSFLGGFIYGFTEVLFRGYTHPSMMLAGGICFLLLYYINLRMKSRSLLLRGLIGSAVITSVEFVFGVIFNLLLGMDVWDYSERPFNILGQICPLFSFIWFVFSIPVVFISVFVSDRLNKRLSFYQES